MCETLRRPRSLASVVAALTLMLLVGDTSLVAEASTGGIRLAVSPPAGPLLAGVPATLAVRAVHADTGAPSAGAKVELEPYGLGARTSSDGWAFFTVSELTTGTVVASWSTDGAPDETALLNWTAPRAGANPPQWGVVGSPLGATLRVSWANGTGIPDVAAGLLQDGELVMTAATDAAGIATLQVPAREAAGIAEYDVAFDEPYLQDAGFSFRVRWELPPAPPNRPPVALFNVTGDLAPRANLTFDAGASYDPDGALLSYAWSFSDGDSATGSVVAHAFSQPGEAWAALVVADDANATDHLRRDLFLVAPPPPPPPPTPPTPPPAPPPPPAPNSPPVARFDVGGDLRPGAILKFDASASEDPDGVLRAYAWSFSDGATANGPVVAHAFSQPGNAWAALTVRDDADATTRARRDFVLATPPPPPAPEPEPQPEAAPFAYVDASGGRHVLPGRDPDTTLLLRALDLPGGSRALLQTPEGLELWDPGNGTIAPVSSAEADVGPPVYEPGLLDARVAVDCDGWCLARFEDPGPGWTFEAGSDAGPVAAWREGRDLVVLATRGSILVRFGVPALQLDAKLTPGADGTWSVSAKQAEGAPIVSLDVHAGTRLVAHAKGPALDAILDVRPGERIVVNARAASGETITRDLGTIPVPIEPESLDAHGQPAGATVPTGSRPAPGPGAAATAGAIIVLCLWMGRRRKPF